jgi:hypothetical protein
MTQERRRYPPFIIPEDGRQCGSLRATIPAIANGHSASRRAFRIARAGTVSTAIDTMLQRWKFGGAWAPPPPCKCCQPLILIAVLSF